MNQLAVLAVRWQCTENLVLTWQDPGSRGKAGSLWCKAQKVVVCVADRAGCRCWFCRRCVAASCKGFTRCAMHHPE